MDQSEPSLETQLRALANSTQARYLTLLSGATLTLLFIFYARNLIRFGEELPVWNFSIGGLLTLANIVILVMASLNRIPEKYAQQTGAALFLIHGAATYTNLVAGVGTGIYASAFTVLALSMCVLNLNYFYATLVAYLSGWLIAINSTQTPAEWMPTLLLILIVAAISLLTLKHRLRALKSRLILENRVRELESFLPVCANCKNVREKSGNWLTLEKYLETSGGKKLTHGVCPSCKDELYSDYFAKREEKRKAESPG